MSRVLRNSLHYQFVSRPPNLNWAHILALHILSDEQITISHEIQLNHLFPYHFSRLTGSHIEKLSQLFATTSAKCPETYQLPADALPRGVGHADSKIPGCLRVDRHTHTHTHTLNDILYYVQNWPPDTVTSRRDRKRAFLAITQQRKKKHAIMMRPCSSNVYTAFPKSKRFFFLYFKSLKLDLVLSIEHLGRNERKRKELF